MRHLMMAGVSILALGMAPAMAQKATGEDKRDTFGMQMNCPDYTAERSGPRSDDILDAIDEAERTAGAVDERDVRHRKDSPTRDAMGDSPVNPGATADIGQDSERTGRDSWSENSQWDRDTERNRDAQTSHDRSFADLAELLPIPDVADREVELRDRTDSPQNDTMRSGAEYDERQEDFSDIIEEGDRIPEEIGRFQDDDTWDRGAGPGQERVNRQDRRDSDREAGDRAESRSEGDTADNRMQETRDSARQERRRQLARLALRSARHAVPNAQLGSYEFKIEDNERVIEFTGRDMESGRRIEVDVYPSGRIQSIDQYIPLDTVPESVRRSVREDLGRFRVAHTKRSLTRDLDIYYEFAGFTRAGRPLAVRIRADGQDMTVRRINRS